MSSREIAELTGKRHDNVRADIEKMGLELSLKFEEKVEPSFGGRPSRVYYLTKRETMILVSGYLVVLRARIVDRWMELHAPSFATNFRVIEMVMGCVNFVETPYIHPQNGQTYRLFEMTRDGFTLLVMGFTGTKRIAPAIRNNPQPDCRPSPFWSRSITRLLG